MTRTLAQKGRLYELDLPFPTAGINLSTAYENQPTKTTANCQNVRAWEISTGRNRGGQRPGLSKFLSNQISLRSIQDINQLKLAEATTETGAMILVATDTAAFSAVDSGGSESIEYGTPSDRLDKSYWDRNGFCFLGFVTAAQTYRLVKCSFDVSVSPPVIGTIRTATFSSNIDSTAKGVRGLVTENDILYVLVSAANAANNLEIWRFDDNTLESLDGYGAWATSVGGDIYASGMPFLSPESTAPELALSDGILAIICNTGTGGNVRVTIDKIRTADKSRDDPAWTYTPYAAFAPGVNLYRAGIVTDYRGFFWAWLPRLATSMSIAKIKDTGSGISGGVLAANRGAAADGICSMTYDATNARMYAVGSDAGQLGTSFCRINWDTLAASGGVDLDGEETWHWIGYAGSKGFRVTKQSAGTNVAGFDHSNNTLFTLNSKDNNQTGNSVNAGDVQGSVTGSIARITNLCVSNGTIKKFNRTESSAPSGGGGGSALSHKTRRVFSAQNGLNMYYVDGWNYKQYTSATDRVEDWVVNAGSLPVSVGSKRARLICTWRGRTVLSGIENDPTNWYMSKKDDPTNWNFDPADTTETMAVSGTANPAGKCEDIINALIPYNDDVLITGGDHSMWRLSGDPAVGGRWDRISDITGIAWGRAWCVAPGGTLFAMGSRGSVYATKPGVELQRISSDLIEEELQDVDFRNVLVSMEWDDRQLGVKIWLTPTDQSVGTHYFWDSRNKGWWRDTVEPGAVLYQPFAVHQYDADDPEDRKVLIGGQDGYIRQIDYDAKNDDDAAIDSFVVIGPVKLRTRHERMRMEELQCILGSLSDNITATIHVGETAEAALAASASTTWIFSAGRNYSRRDPIIGDSIYLKLRNNSLGQSWQFEKIRAWIRQVSRESQRAWT